MMTPTPSLRWKLLGSLGSAVAISLIISVIALTSQVFAQAAASQRINRLTQAHDTLAQLKLAILIIHEESHRLIAAIQSRRSDAAMPVTLTTFHSIDESLARLTSLSQSIPALAPFDQQLHRLNDQRQQTLAQVADTTVLRQRFGRTEQVLRNAFRELAQTLERQGASFREAGLRLALEEQAYLLTGRQEHVDNVRIRINQLQTAAIALPTAERDAVQRSAQTYLAAFLNLVSLNRDLQSADLQLSYVSADLIAVIDDAMRMIDAEQRQAAVALTSAGQGLYWLIGWMIISSVAIFGAWIWVANHYFNRPLVELTAAAKRVASGWRDTPIPLIGTDELGDLSRALATMAAHLNDLIAHQEEQVAQRTAQLRAALANNEALLAAEQRRRRLSKALVDLSLALNEASDEATIYRLVIDTLAVDAGINDRIGIYIRDKASQLWLPRHTYGYRHNPLMQLKSTPIIEQPQSSPWYIPDLSQYQSNSLPNVEGSAIVVAITRHERAHAILVIYRPVTDAFTEDEIATLGVAARLISRALTQANLVESLRQAKEAAEMINRERSRFLSRLSNDLRQPLNTMITTGELLREALATNPALADDAGKIAHAGRRLLNRLNTLIESAKIEAGELTLQPEPLFLDELVDDVLSEIAPLIRRNQSRLEIDRPPSLGLIVADLQRLRQALFNPLRFAAATTHRGMVRVTFRRLTAVDGLPQFECIIKDTGPALSQAQIQSLVTPFAMPAADARRVDDGHGLAFSYQLCALMGGALQIEGGNAAGLTITIRLPITVDESGEAELPAPDIVLVTAIDALTLQTALEQAGWSVQCETALDQTIVSRYRRPKLLALDLPADRAPIDAMLRDIGWEETPVIWLTAAQVADVEIAVARWPGDPAKIVQMAQALLTQPKPVSRTILLIEDHIDTSIAIRRLLESDGWHVIVAGTGQEGAQLWRETQPPLVILDLMLPDVDGLQLLTDMRRQLQTPVIVITAKVLSDEDQAVLAASATRVLQKGRFRRNDLLTLARQLAGRGDGDA